MNPNSHQPLVSVVTPVYNGEQYLSECIESVLAQTYPHWEYIIVNNCSTDDTLPIIERYSRSDTRIRVFNNQTFVDAIDNHNIALGYLSPASRYCKVLQADDWLYPSCLERMVQRAQQYPSAGIIGGYVLWHNHVGSDGLAPASRGIR